MKALKIALSIVLWIVFIILALIAIGFLVNGGWQTFADKIKVDGFWEFIKWFFQWLVGKAPL